MASGATLGRNSWCFAAALGVGDLERRLIVFASSCHQSQKKRGPKAPLSNVYISVRLEVGVDTEQEATTNELREVQVVTTSRCQTCCVAEVIKDVVHNNAR